MDSLRKHVYFHGSLYICEGWNKSAKYLIGKFILQAVKKLTTENIVLKYDGFV